jgi:hypothetical protein
MQGGLSRLLQALEVVDAGGLTHCVAAPSGRSLYLVSRPSQPGT